MAAGLLALSKLEHDRRGVKLNMEIQCDTGQMPSAVQPEARVRDPTASLDNKHSLGVTLLQITQCFQDPAQCPAETQAPEHISGPGQVLTMSSCCEALMGMAPTAEIKPAEPKIHSRKERWCR